MLPHFKLLSLILIFTNIANSQNLVSNPSFEIKDKTKKTSRLHPSEGIPLNWSPALERSTPDYYNSIVERYFRNLKNAAEKVKANDGINFIGLMLQYGNYSEHIQTNLKSPLKKRKLYKCSFYILLSKHSKFSTDDVGMFISKERINIKQLDSSDRFIPQIKNPEGEIIDNLEEWKMISGYYLAKGGEQYITIGKYRPQRQLILTLSPRKKVKARIHLEKTLGTYYLFDNVSITEITDSIQYDRIITKKNASPLSYNIDSQSNALKDDSLNDKLPSKNKIVLQNILFDINDSILGGNEEELDEVYQLLIQNRSFNIQVFGHTDNIGQEVENKKLSLARANSVKNYLINKGVNEERIKIFGFGSAKPISLNETKEDRRINRRVEIKIYSNKNDFNLR